MAGKYRAQILLEPEQHTALVRLAQNQGRSISEVAREIIRIGLAIVEEDEGALWERRMRAFERLGKIREAARQRYGVYQGDLVAEVRAERERQNEQVWKQEAET